MSHAVSIASRVLVCVFLFGAIPVQAQKAAPIPFPIRSAKRVFIANAGADALVSSLDQGKGTGDQYYGLFYSAMQAWANYKLVDSPSDADLVLEIYASCPVTSVSNGAARIQPQIQVSILDAKTHFLLWRLTESLEANHPKLFGGVGGKGDKLDIAIDGIVRQLKALAGSPAQPTSQ